MKRLGHGVFQIPFRDSTTADEIRHCVIGSTNVRFFVEDLMKGTVLLHNPCRGTVHEGFVEPVTQGTLETKETLYSIETLVKV